MKLNHTILIKTLTYAKYYVEPLFISSSVFQGTGDVLLLQGKSSNATELICDWINVVTCESFLDSCQFNFSTTEGSCEKSFSVQLFNSFSILEKIPSVLFVTYCATLIENAWIRLNFKIYGITNRKAFKFAIVKMGRK